MQVWAWWIHIIGVVLISVILFVRAISLFKNKEHFQPSAPMHVGIQHLALTLLVLSGVALLSMTETQIQSWFYAKVILFVVMLSSLHKAYKKDETILLIQRRGGWVIAVVAWMALFGLILIQPNFL